MGTQGGWERSSSCPLKSTEGGRPVQTQGGWSCGSRVRTHHVRNDPLTREEAPREHQEEMGDGPVFGLSGEGGQADGIRPLFPKEHGVGSGWMTGRCQVASSIVIQKGLCWVDAPAAYNPHKTLDNRCRCWSDKGVFDLIFSELSASDAPEPEVMMLDATDIKAHPTASSLNKGGCPPPDWWHQGGHDQQAPWGL